MNFYQRLTNLWLFLNCHVWDLKRFWKNFIEVFSWIFFKSINDFRKDFLFEYGDSALDGTLYIFKCSFYMKLIHARILLKLFNRIKNATQCKMNITNKKIIWPSHWLIWFSICFILFWYCVRNFFSIHIRL